MGKIAGKIKSTSEISLSIQSPAMPIRCMQGTPYRYQQTSIANSINSTQQKRATKEASTRTFETVAREWHKNKRKCDANHAKRILASRGNHVFPTPGKYDIAKLKTRDLLISVKTKEARNKLQTANRLQ